MSWRLLGDYSIRIWLCFIYQS